jgi:hypothetical protein
MQKPGFTVALLAAAAGSLAAQEAAGAQNAPVLEDSPHVQILYIFIEYAKTYSVRPCETSNSYK